MRTMHLIAANEPPPPLVGMLKDARPESNQIF